MSSAQQLVALLGRAVERAWLAVAIAAAITIACFYATGGLDLGTAAVTEMVLTLGCGALVAAAVVQEGSRRMRLWGGGTAAAFMALAAFTALSVGWSVEPSDSWIEAGRTLSYAAAFAGGLALVRLAATRWRSVIVGILLASVVISAYALATKVFPGAAPLATTYARLQAPFIYWNIVGLTAALGVPPALWLGTRRDGHGALAALSPPAICLALVTVMLSYSRGSLLALIVGLVVWFVFVPLRLRSAAVLAIGAAGALIVVAWEFSQSALTTDYVVPAAGPNLPWSQYVSEGHELGWLLLAVLLACAAGGLIVRFAAVRHPPAPQLRRRIGLVLIGCVALVPVVVVIGLAASSRGLAGSISHDVSTLTNTNVSVPNNASRLTTLGSERAVYWRDAIDAFDANPIVGSGAGSWATTHLRYDTSALNVFQAHSYVFQTLADLGIVGMALSVLLAGAWLTAAWRTAGPLVVRSRPGPSESAERLGLLTLITVVLIYAVHSTFDIDWFVPGAMMIPLLCAGWVAGRGAHGTAPGGARVRLALLREDPWLAGAFAATVVVTLLIAWTQWQPLRSFNSYNAAELAIGNGQFAIARADTNAAISENPLDYQPLIVLSELQIAMHHERAAYGELVRAVRLQPSNWETWYQLAYFDYNNLNEPRAALTVLQRALYLAPHELAAQGLYITLLPAASAHG